MALYTSGVNYVKANDPSSANIIDPGLLGGKVRVMQDYASIGASSNLNSTDHIYVGGKLPTGAQVVKIIVGTDAQTSLGTQGTLFVGDQGNVSRYATSIQVSSAQVHVLPNFSSTGASTANGGMYYSVTGTTDNYIRLSGAANGTRISTSTIKVSIFYVVE